MNVQAQINSHDCGVYALGFITKIQQLLICRNLEVTLYNHFV